MSTVRRCSSPADAWDFVSFALGHDAPPFADTVRVLVPGSVPMTFTAQEAADGGRWDEAFDLIATAAHQAAPTSTGMPALDVDVTIPPDLWCGVPRPPETGDASRSASRSTPARRGTTTAAR